MFVKRFENGLNRFDRVSELMIRQKKYGRDKAESGCFWMVDLDSRSG